MPDMDRNQVDALIAAVGRADPAAFDALYGATSARIYALCLSILGDRVLAQEALHQIYVDVWRQAGRQPESGLSGLAWLVTIARNHALDLRRGRGAAGSSPTAPPPMAAAATPAAARLAACLAQLPAPEAAALRTAWATGASYAELAAATGIAAPELRARLRHALSDLQACIDP